MTKSLILLLILFFSHIPMGIGSIQTSPSHHAFKKALLDVHQNHRFTFFCHEPYSSEAELTVPCADCPPVQMKIQWMPIIPASQLAAHLTCYQEKICVNRYGKPYKGIACCQKSDSTYQVMRIDLHNWVPENPILKQKRRQWKFGLVNETPPDKGCHLLLDKKHQKIEPSPQIRGMIARTYLYMRDKYHLPLSEEEVLLYLNWHKMYPVSAWEQERNKKIDSIQGNNNHYIH